MHKEKQAQVRLNHDKIQLYSVTRLFRFANVLHFENEISQRMLSRSLKSAGAKVCHLLTPVMFHYKWHSWTSASQITDCELIVFTEEAVGGVRE